MLFLNFQYHLMSTRILCFIAFLSLLFLALIGLGYCTIQYMSLVPCLGTVSIPLNNDPNCLDVHYSYNGVSYTAKIWNDNLLFINDITNKKEINGFVSRYFPQDFYTTKSFNWMQILFNFSIVAVFFIIYKILDIIYYKNRTPGNW